jgi:sarcosine oxidase, subunit delta
MITLRCPYCNEVRVEDELTHGGEFGILRPTPETASSDDWTDYLFMRVNRKGFHGEQWCCTYGCGQWFLVVRHTVTHEVTKVLRIDQAATLQEGV